ncbi:hypothetical protein NPIL_215841 [Nephila pilipes]|uniref:Uncharacterized protein n=1 Tax=Nephila pilipes TaxID=299642 RepID=A0A8X6NFJ3_NEPPI|nr:hypothetical protein NPIL_215841 [Nephila pilipes]
MHLRRAGGCRGRAERAPASVQKRPQRREDHVARIPFSGTQPPVTPLLQKGPLLPSPLRSNKSPSGWSGPFRGWSSKGGTTPCDESSHQPKAIMT